jgi:DNA-binding transcriptional ArsR family regulator
MSKQVETQNPELQLLRALSHPLRWQILQALNLRTASPSELAREIGVPLPNLAYHIRVLVENDAIELVKTAPVRGALEHFYRATMRPWLTEEMFEQLPASARRAIFSEILRDIWSDVAAAAVAGELDDPTTHIMRNWLALDQQAYEELIEAIDALQERALELHAEAAPRLASMSEDERVEHRTAMMLMHFHRAPASDPGAPRGDRVNQRGSRAHAGRPT